MTYLVYEGVIQFKTKLFEMLKLIPPLAQTTQTNKEQKKAEMCDLESEIVFERVRE